MNPHRASRGIPSFKRIQGVSKKTPFPIPANPRRYPGSQKAAKRSPISRRAFFRPGNRTDSEASPREDSEPPLRGRNNENILLPFPLDHHSYISSFTNHPSFEAFSIGEPDSFQAIILSPNCKAGFFKTVSLYEHPSLLSAFSFSGVPPEFFPVRQKILLVVYFAPALSPMRKLRKPGQVKNLNPETGNRKPTKIKQRPARKREKTAHEY